MTFLFNEKKINWSEPNARVRCKSQFHQRNNECDNYIRGSVPLLDSHLMITCGTNSNQPYCRKFTLNNKSGYVSGGKLKDNVSFKPQPVQTAETFSNTQNIPPFNYMNSIYYFHASLQSQDIYKQNYLFDSNQNFVLSDLIQTPQGAILNPNFRSSYGYKDKVYFFFSESELSHFKNGVSFKVIGSQHRDAYSIQKFIFFII